MTDKLFKTCRCPLFRGFTVFSRPPCRRKPENIHSNQFNKKLVVDHSNKPDDFAAIFEVAKILRRDIMNLPHWKFNGSFDDLKIPKSLRTLLEWVLVGPSPSLTNESVKKLQLNII